MRLRQIAQDVFVADEPAVQFSRQEIAFLKQRIHAAARGRVRLCAHGGDEDPVHEMLIAIARDCYVRPHKHVDKSESFHIAEGAADVLVFDEQGRISEVVPLRAAATGGPFYYRLSQPRYHTLVVRSELAVVHETTRGPFRKDAATLASWAPAEDAAESRRFLSELAEAATRFLADGARPRPAVGPHTLIIGGTRGIGREVTRLFSARGHAVSVVGGHAAAVADQRLDGVAHWTADLTDHAGLANVLAAIVARGGPLDNLVFLQRFRGAGDPWLGELETSLTATRFVIDCLTKEFRAGADNSIVMVSSVANRLVLSNQPLGYHVAKAGLSQMVRCYAASLGPRGIRVNGVSPGIVVKEENREAYRAGGDLERLLTSCSPLGRMGDAADVASVIAFLCSSQAAFVTGQEIVVDGGMSLLSHESLARGLHAQSGRPTRAASDHAGDCPPGNHEARVRAEEEQNRGT